MAQDEPWWRGATIYQIYPRSFADSDGDGVGDLRGIIGKLEHVAGLGVDAVWLSPFFTSPMKDFGYDVADYRGVDPLFGTLEDFDVLLERAHALGLKVIIDQVWSHTSDQHAWFKESRAGRKGPKADWYVWADAKPDGSPPNNWQAVFGGPSWEWDPGRRQYYLHNFLAEQPDLNFHNPQLQDAILDVARFWLDRGVDGFRLDVINLIAHDAALTDNPPIAQDRTPARTVLFQRHLHDRSRPEALEFVARLRALIDGYGERMLVGEIFGEQALARQREYTDGADRLHTAYSFYLLDAQRASPSLFETAMAAWDGAAGWPSWSLSNHDVPRFASRLAGGSPQRARVLMAALLCLRGTIFLYQGDELGLPQARVPFERLRDPFAIRAFDGGAGRDGARTPFPWTAAPGAGFSEAEETWLPIDPAHLALAAEGQGSDPDSMLAFTRRLVALRRATPALRWGAFATLTASPGVLAFERRYGAARTVCAFDLAGDGGDMALEGEWRVADSGLAARWSSGRLTLPSFGGAVLV